ncbi:uncharacterized protein PFB0460c-like [Lingula anatina]|uniref:Uncharacterized protein PFB0460c-like n=1 Tax=Lingula anatina TaxID=7574 RepID=A0A1S3JJK7_LINAN|nr:uncharacterized protein PFB0460c-like [Lingula anatina]|eukprot:XP_013410595.1 uncharacterized protein PFB0460c-like [Lingula anatina]
MINMDFDPVTAVPSDSVGAFFTSSDHFQHSLTAEHEESTPSQNSKSCLHQDSIIKSSSYTNDGHHVHFSSPLTRIHILSSPDSSQSTQDASDIFEEECSSVKWNAAGKMLHKLTSVDGGEKGDINEHLREQVVPCSDDEKNGSEQCGRDKVYIHLGDTFKDISLQMSNVVLGKDNHVAHSVNDSLSPQRFSDYLCTEKNICQNFPERQGLIEDTAIKENSGILDVVEEDYIMADIQNEHNNENTEEHLSEETISGGSSKSLPIIVGTHANILVQPFENPLDMAKQSELSPKNKKVSHLDSQKGLIYQSESKESVEMQAKEVISDILNCICIENNCQGKEKESQTAVDSISMFSKHVVQQESNMNCLKRKAVTFDRESETPDSKVPKMEATDLFVHQYLCHKSESKGDFPIAAEDSERQIQENKSPFCIIAENNDSNIQEDQNDCPIITGDSESHIQEDKSYFPTEAVASDSHIPEDKSHFSIIHVTENSDSQIQEDKSDFPIITEVSDSHIHKNECDFRPEAYDRHCHNHIDDGHCHIQADDSHCHSQADDIHSHIQADDSHCHSQADDIHCLIEADNSHCHIQADDSHCHSQAGDSHCHSQADNSHSHSQADDSHYHNQADDSHYHSQADDSHSHSQADDSHCNNQADDSHCNNQADDGHCHSQADDSHYHSQADDSHCHSQADDSHCHSQADDIHSHIQADDSHCHSQADDIHCLIEADNSHCHIQADDSHCHSQAGDSHCHSQADNSHSHSQADDSHYHNQADDSHYHSQADDSHSHSQADDSHCNNQADDSHYHNQADDGHCHSQADDSHYHSQADDSDQLVPCTGTFSVSCNLLEMHDSASKTGSPYGSSDDGSCSKLYSCDLDLLDEMDILLCSPVEKKALFDQSVSPVNLSTATSPVLHSDSTPQSSLSQGTNSPSKDTVFRWQKQIVKNAVPEDSLPSILPLPTCRKPLRIGLSRKQKVQPLHLRFQPKHSQN